MSKKFKFFIPCNQANHVCDKTQYKEASLWEKLKLNLHLIYCKACRKYSKNNATLTDKVKASKIACLDKKCKESMKKDFEKAIKKHSH